ncbi:MAG: CoA transferase [Chloroflexi bacterium]|nr:CoA transferase [Chloroflexota bacterium]
MAHPLGRSRLARSSRVPRPSGERVLEFSLAVTVPFVARLLAEHGAEVIKVEWGARLDPLRFFPPPAGYEQSERWRVLEPGQCQQAQRYSRPEPAASTRVRPPPCPAERRRHR